MIKDRPTTRTFRKIDRCMGELNPVNKSLCLEMVCESNYYKLLRLAPDFSQIDAAAVAVARGKPSLHLKVIEKAPYTRTLELSHCFDKENSPSLEPAVKLQVYLDTRSVEVLHDAFRPPFVKALKRLPESRALMDYKWSLNYFLEKWLSHCLQSGYRFNSEATLEQAV